MGAVSDSDTSGWKWLRIQEKAQPMLEGGAGGGVGLSYSELPL